MKAYLAPKREKTRSDVVGKKSVVEKSTEDTKKRGSTGATHLLRSRIKSNKSREHPAEADASDKNFMVRESSM